MNRYKQLDETRKRLIQRYKELSEIQNENVNKHIQEAYEQNISKVKLEEEIQQLIFNKIMNARQDNKE